VNRHFCSIVSRITHHASRTILTLHSFIKARHCALDAFGQDYFHCFRAPIEHLLQVVAAARWNRRKHNANKIVDRMAGLYTKPYSCELPSTQPFNYRLQSVMPAGASPRSHADHPDRQSYIIASDDQVSGVRVGVPLNQRSNGIPAQIHKGLRLHQQHSLASERDVRNFRVCFTAKAATPGPLK
jgi:hypothetical protein